MNSKLDSDTKENGILNEHFSKKMNSGKYLLTTRHGSFVFLDAKEYDSLFQGTFREDKALLAKLSDVGIVITKENIPKIIGSLKNQFMFFSAPKSYIINISDKCNLGCTYCLANAGPKQSKTMSKKTMDRTRKFILSSPQTSFHLEFQGGEPLEKFDMIKEFISDIKEDAKSSGKKIQSIVLVSNLTLMTEKIAEYIIENNIGLCSSLDGPKELHNINRKFIDGEGSYDEVTKWITYFRECGKTVNILPTISAYSLKFGSKAIIDEYLSHGYRKVMFRPIYQIGRAKERKDLHVNPEEFFQFWKEGLEYMFELSAKGTSVYDPVIRAMIRNMTGFPRSYMCMRKPCGAGISQISISPDGTIFPCDLAKTIQDLEIGNVKENYYDVAQRTIYMNTRTSESQPLCDTCVFTAYCGTCFTRTYARFSDTVSRTPLDFDCKVNKAMFEYLFEKMQDEKYMKMFKTWATLKR